MGALNKNKGQFIVCVWGCDTGVRARAVVKDNTLKKLQRDACVIIFCPFNGTNCSNNKCLCGSVYSKVYMSDV